MTSGGSAGRTGILAIPGVAYMVLAFAAPLAWICASSFWVEGQLSIANYVRYLGDPFYLGVIGYSVFIASATTALTLTIGYPAAVAMARCRPSVQTACLAMVFTPLTVGTIFKTFGWTIVLRRNGIVNNLLVALGVVDDPVPLLFNQFALIFGMSNVFLPYMILPIFATVRQIDSRLADSAATLGAGPVFTFLHVLLPLSLPGIVGGAALVFSLSLAAYVTPLLLAGDKFTMMSMVIARGFLYVGNPPLGATMAVIMLAITSIVLLGGSLLAARSRAS
jgi:putative spermidine/putrescine transport system permease protein